jgi:hypothetical protein
MDRAEPECDGCVVVRQEECFRQTTLRVVVGKESGCWAVAGFWTENGMRAGRACLTT